MILYLDNWIIGQLDKWILGQAKQIDSHLLVSCTMFSLARESKMIFSSINVCDYYLACPNTQLPNKIGNRASIKPADFQVFSIEAQETNCCCLFRPKGSGHF